MCSVRKELVLAQVVSGLIKSELYVVDLEAEKARRTPVATLLNETGGGCMVLLVSAIYNVGGRTTTNSDHPNLQLIHGDHHIHTGLSCLGLSKPYLLSLLKEQGDAHSDSIKWSVATAMKYARMSPSCASLGGKIYAFGSSGPVSPIGDVFLPELDVWNPIKPPPHVLPLEHFEVASPVIPDEANKRLLVHFRTAHALYAYYPDDNRKWECLSRTFRYLSNATALVDGVLYSHLSEERDCLVAYDVINKSRLKVVFSSDFPVGFCVSEFESMLHLGNDMLCLANSFPLFDKVTREPTNRTNLQFIKFTVDRSTPTEMIATPVAVNCFPLFEKLLRNVYFIAL